MRDFTQVVRDNVSEYRGMFSRFVRWAPIFAAALMALSQDPRLGQRHRAWVNAALAYFVAPDDAMPEEEHGAYGYLDDNFVSAYVMERIAREAGWNLIEDAWGGDREAREVIRDMLDRERELLGDLGEEALTVAGVLERRRDPPEEEQGPVGAAGPSLT